MSIGDWLLPAAHAEVAPRLQEVAQVPTVLDTDVNGAAFAEMKWGAGRGMEDFAYVTVGTGVGVGLIVGGRRTGGFGHCELGHIRVARLAGDDWRGSCPFHVKSATVCDTIRRPS